jgi:WD40 repeat protein
MGENKGTERPSAGTGVEATGTYYKYDAFISYSHKTDGFLAPAVQRGLHRLARRWYRPRALRISRDKTSLPATDNLWGGIERALTQSRYFILLASRPAAGSDWVARELDWWKDHHGVDRLLIVLTDGEIAWDGDRADFDWGRTTALPSLMAGWFANEPLWVDLRWARKKDLSVRHGRFRQDVATLAAPIHGTSPDALESEDIRQHKRFQLIRRTVAVVLVLSAVATSVSAVVAVGQRDRARARQQQATSRQFAAESLLAAQADPRHSMELARLAWARWHTAEARSALLSAQMSTYAGEFGAAKDGISVALSPDGAVLAVGHADGRVRLWDTAAHRPAGPDLTGHAGRVVSVAFSPDGQMLAAAADGLDKAGAPLAKRESVRVWAVPGGRLLRTLPGTGAGLAAWRPDGRALLDVQFGAADGGLGWLIGVWDPRTGRRQAAIPVDRPTQPVVDLAVSPDGAWAALGRADGSAGVWDLARGSPAATVTGHAAGVVRVALGRGGILATAGEDGAVVLWSLPGGKQIRRLTGEHAQRGLGAIAFTRTGDALLALGGGKGKSLQGWSIPDGRPQTPLLAVLPGVPHDLAVAGDGRTVAVAGLGMRPYLASLVPWVGHPDIVLDLDFAPSGRLATAALDGAVQVWDPASKTRTAVVRHGREADSVAYAPDGTLASATSDGTVVVWDPAGNERAVLTTGSGAPADLAFSPDGSQLAMILTRTPGSRPPGGETDDRKIDDRDKSDGEENQVYVWDARTLRRRAVLEAGGAGTGALAFAEDGRRLLAVTTTTEAGITGVRQRSTFRAWRTGDFRGEPTVDLGGRLVVDVAVSPDGGTLALNGGDGGDRGIELRNPDGTRLGEFGGHPSDIRDLAFSPDGRTIATVTVGDPVVRLWDVASRTLLANLTGHLDSLNAVAFSRDGRLLASGGADKLVGLWHTDPGDADRHLCRVLEGSRQCK